MFSRALVTSLLLALGFGPAPAALAQDGDALAKEAATQLGAAVDAIDEVLADESATPDQQRAQIGRILDRALDLAFISSRALGEKAQAFSPEELAEFSHEFGHYAVGLYERRIASERGMDFEIVASRWDERTKTVIVETEGGKPIVTEPLRRKRQNLGPAKVGYRVRRRHGEWRIISIVIDGVSVTRRFHDDFASVLTVHTPAELNAELRRRNAEAERENPFAA